MGFLATLELDFRRSNRLISLGFFWGGRDRPGPTNALRTRLEPFCRHRSEQYRCCRERRGACRPRLCRSGRADQCVLRHRWRWPQDVDGELIRLGLKSFAHALHSAMRLLLRELELQQPGPIGLPDRKERLSAASGLVRLGLCRLDLILSCSRNGAAETGSS